MGSVLFVVKDKRVHAPKKCSPLLVAVDCCASDWTDAELRSTRPASVVDIARFKTLVSVSVTRRSGIMSLSMLKLAFVILVLNCLTLASKI